MSAPGQVTRRERQCLDGEARAPRRVRWRQAERRAGVAASLQEIPASDRRLWVFLLRRPRRRPAGGSEDRQIAGRFAVGVDPGVGRSLGLRAYDRHAVGGRQRATRRAVAGARVRIGQVRDADELGRGGRGRDGNAVGNVSGAVSRHGAARRAATSCWSWRRTWRVRIRTSLAGLGDGDEGRDR